MKRIKAFQKVIFMVLLSFFLISCSSTLQTGVKQVRLGMSRSEVMSRIGNDYQVVSLVQTGQGDLEVLRYTHRVMGSDVEHYILHFLDGKLVELNYEDATLPSHPHPHK